MNYYRLKHSNLTFRGDFFGGVGVMEDAVNYIFKMGKGMSSTKNTSKFQINGERKVSTLRYPICDSLSLCDSTK